MNAILRGVLISTAFLCGLAPLSARAKSAEDYLHGGAYKYIEGKIQEASVEVEEGLRLYPDDPRLTALAGQLRKMKDQQRGNSGQDQDQKKDQGKKPGDPDNQDPGKKNPGEKDGDKDGDKQGDKDKPQPKPGDDPEDKEGRDGQGSPPPNRMSEEEAKRLLNSFADDEKKEQAERRRAVRRRAGTEQDW